MRYVQTWAGQGGVPAGVERHCPLPWADFEPRAGQYDFGRIEKLLSAQATPCHLQLVVSMYGKMTGLLDYTPAVHRRSLPLTAANGKTGAIPDYANAAWQTAYRAAIAALAARYRDDVRVVGYQLALGLNQETQATCITVDGSNWNTPAAKLLAEDGYYRFILATTQAAVVAWGQTPVYVPGAPSPGTTWNTKRRDVVVAALATGARYLSCGLDTDNSNATGLGVRAGEGMTDIISATGAGCAFEARNGAGTDPLGLYWLLLRAAHWQADFVQLQSSWYQAGHWTAVRELLPAAGAAWLVFRDREYPAQTWLSANGQTYGQSGEAGPWGRGLTWRSGGTLTSDLSRSDRARWLLTATTPVILGVPVPDGPLRLRLTYPDGATQDGLATVTNGQTTLPAGRYHRVDVLAAPPREPLPQDEPQATATKVRWWLEELARQAQAGNTTRAAAILAGLITLAYRLEAVTPDARTPAL